jgi:hypothetical protein
VDINKLLKVVERNQLILLRILCEMAIINFCSYTRLRKEDIVFSVASYRNTRGFSITSLFGRFVKK